MGPEDGRECWTIKDEIVCKCLTYRNNTMCSVYLVRRGLQQRGFSANRVGRVSEGYSAGGEVGKS